MCCLFCVWVVLPPTHALSLLHARLFGSTAPPSPPQGIALRRRRRRRRCLARAGGHERPQHERVHRHPQRVRLRRCGDTQNGPARALAATLRYWCCCKGRCLAPRRSGRRLLLPFRLPLLAGGLFYWGRVMSLVDTLFDSCVGLYAAGGIGSAQAPIGWHSSSVPFEGWLSCRFPGGSLTPLP